MEHLAIFSVSLLTLGTSKGQAEVQALQPMQYFSSWITAPESVFTRAPGEGQAFAQAGCSLPEPALYMIRYHSFYPWHREEEYGHLLNEHDRQMLPWVRKFNPYDLYSKNPQRPDWNRLAPYYIALIDKYLPGPLRW